MLINKHLDQQGLFATFTANNTALKGIGINLVASIVACRAYTMFFTGKDVKQAAADKALWDALKVGNSRSKFYQVRKPGYAVSNLMAEGGEASKLAAIMRDATSNDDAIAKIKTYINKDLACDTVDDIYGKVIGKRLIDPSKPSQEKATTAQPGNMALRLVDDPEARNIVLNKVLPVMPEAERAERSVELLLSVVTLSTAATILEAASKHVASLTADKDHAQGEATRKRSEGRRNRRQVDKPEPVAKVG